MIIKKRLTEDTIDAAVNAAQSGGTSKVEGDGHELERLLDEIEEANLDSIYSGTRDFVNLLVVGQSGIGKTDRIKAWAKSKGYNIVTKIASLIDEADLSGIQVASEKDTEARRVPSTDFKGLDVPFSILFLDEFNRARDTTRAAFLTLIQNHTVQDNREPSGERFLPNFLFTVAAINPASTYATHELDGAEISRFVVYHASGANKADWIEWFENSINKKITNLQKVQIPQGSNYNPQKAIAKLQRILNLAKFLIKDPRFTFDSAEDEAKSVAAKFAGTGNGQQLNYRTLTDALYSSDGTKDNFLTKFRLTCNDQKYDTVKEILNNYKDIDDKANQALDYDTEDDIFKSAKEMRKNKLDDLDTMVDTLK